jgi:hypothetical protein
LPWESDVSQWEINWPLCKKDSTYLSKHSLVFEV